MSYSSKSLLLLAPLALLLFLSMPTTLPDFDSGEFAVIAANGGVAHPPGYPLLCILLQTAALFKSMLPLITSICLVSVICSLTAAALIFRIIFEYSKNYAASASGVYGVFLSHIVWRAGTTPEPFALNLLLASVCLYALWKILENSANKSSLWFSAAGLSFGLAFCNHHSLAFFLPFAGYVWFIAPSSKIKNLIKFFSGALLGLIPLIYFFSPMADGPYAWGDWTDPFSRLIIHLFRQEYGTSSLMVNSNGSGVTSLLFFIKSLPKTLSIFFLLFSLGGCLYVIPWAKQSGEKNTSVLHFFTGLAITFFFTGIVFPCMMKISGLPWELSIVERFFALPIMLLAFPISLFILWAGHMYKKKEMIMLMCIVCILFHAAWQWPAADRRLETFYESHVSNILKIAENNSIIITESDTSFFGLLYGKYCLKIKPDVTLLQSGLWQSDWYRRRFFREIGWKDHPLPEKIVTVTSRFIPRRPVYLLDMVADVSPLLVNSYPIGPLIRLLPPDHPLPPPLDLFQLNRLLYDRKLILPAQHQAAYLNTWEQSLLKPYRRPWEALGKAFSQSGNEKMAQLCREYEKRY